MVRVPSGVILQDDGAVVGGSVVVVFAEQAAVAGAVLAAFGAVVEVVEVAVDGFLVTAGPAAALITRRDRRGRR